MSEPENRVSCSLCFRNCQIPEGKKGFCRTKANINGQLVDTSYGKITALALDPIEKKPLARFYPGSRILSVGAYGCSLRCPFCQNWEISQQDLQEQARDVTPQFLVDKALELQNKGNIGICFTYNEPFVQLDFMLETFRLAKEKGLKTAIVTSGSAAMESLEKILPFTDAMNIDLKGFDRDFYDWIGGDFETTKKFIARAARDCHVELTTLVIPQKNDDPAKMEAMTRWIADLDENIPLHLSRYFPRYQCQIPATPVETLVQLKEIAQKHLHHVYLGNV